MKLPIFCPFRLKTPIRAPKIGGFRVFHPQSGEQYQLNPKRHTLARVSASFEPSISNVKIRQRVWLVGEFPKKGINNQLRYISPICPEATHGWICTKFGTAIRATDVITCTNFWRSVKGILCGSKITISY